MEGQQHVEARLDRVIQREVVAELDWDPRVRLHAIGVIVKHGVVTLTGSVEAFGQRRAAAEAASRVRGVAAVANQIEVRLPRSSERTDAEIAAAASHALAASSALNAEDIEVTVADGAILLNGEVDWNYQKNDAEEAVRDLWGVRSVTNLLVARERVRQDH
jgi:osmotically-inducible protein OsmY